MLIASVSTIPGRLSSLVRVLERLKDQTMPPDLLIVTIASFYPRLKLSYPSEDVECLRTYLSTYPFPSRIERIETDIGPVVKLVVPLATLKTIRHGAEPQPEEHDVVFIFDDDSVVYDEAIALLWNAYLRNRDAVYGLMGVIEQGSGESPQFIHGEYLPEDIPSMDVDVLGGYRSVLYPVRLLTTLPAWVDAHVKAHREKGMVAMHDDHIFAYYCQSLDIPRRIVRIPFDANNPTKIFTSDCRRNDRVLFYEPIDNQDGIFADPLSHASYELIRETVASIRRPPPSHVA